MGGRKYTLVESISSRTRAYSMKSTCTRCCTARLDERWARAFISKPPDAHGRPRKLLTPRCRRKSAFISSKRICFLRWKNRGLACAKNIPSYGIPCAWWAVMSETVDATTPSDTIFARLLIPQTSVLNSVKRINICFQK